MKTGVELISDERKEQLTKHLRSLEKDIKYNNLFQLANAAGTLLFEYDNKGEVMSENLDFRRMGKPDNWDSVIWEKMINKSYKDRLILAGALIAAELDRINNEK